MEQSDLLHYMVEVLERMSLRYFVSRIDSDDFFGEPVPRTTSTSLSISPPARSGEALRSFSRSRLLI